MITGRRFLVSEHEFLALPETMDKVELVDGEVVVSPSPTFRHQEIVRRLVVALSLWAQQQGCPVTVGMSPLDIRFARGRILQPDLFVLFSGVPADHSGPLDKVPELCIEVVSNDRVYDRVTKRALYAESGVVEYWIVEPTGPVERRTGPGLHQIEEVTGTLCSALLPGFSLDLDRLFA